MSETGLAPEEASMGDCSLELPPFVALKAFRKLTWSDQRCSFQIPRETPGEG